MSCISVSTAAYFSLPTVKLPTMLTSAAPIAPMIAAALPPPGVESALASASRNFAIGCLVIVSNPWAEQRAIIMQPACT